MSKEEHLATRTTGLQGSELASGEFCLLKKSDPDHLQCLTHLMFYCMQITSAVALWNVLSLVRILAPTMYIFFASALPVIAFGEQLSNETSECFSS
jgi:hypothetical protein